MLGVKSYSSDYIDGCRRKVADQVGAYRAVAEAVGSGTAATAVRDLEPTYFNALVIVLDACFTHRLRGVEGKDGNPLNEVRSLNTSLLEHDGVLTVEKAIKLKPDTSVLGIEAGAPVALTEEQFTRLAEAFFAEIDVRFSEA
jgi:hypothetical protein